MRLHFQITRERERKERAKGHPGPSPYPGRLRRGRRPNVHARGFAAGACLLQNISEGSDEGGWIVGMQKVIPKNPDSLGPTSSKRGPLLTCDLVLEKAHNRVPRCSSRSLSRPTPISNYLTEEGGRRRGKRPSAIHGSRPRPPCTVA